MVREYELGLVINPDLSDEQTEAQIVRIGQLIESHRGEISRLDRWGRRRLAYPVQRHREGYYAFLTFTVEGEAVREIERFLQVQEEIMRHLIVFLDPRTKAERQRRLDMAAAAAAAASAAAQQPAPEAEPDTVAESTAESEPMTEHEPVESAPAEASVTAAPDDRAAEGEPTPVE
jgi:small subunit ribosomal protein S6